MKGSRDVTALRAPALPAQSGRGGRFRKGGEAPLRGLKTRDLDTQYLELKRKVPLEELYTNDLLPQNR